VGWLVCVGGRSWLLFFWAGCPCPWFGGWNELKCVFGVAAVAFFNFLEEGRAFSAPAAVSIRLHEMHALRWGLGQLTVLCSSVQLPHLSVSEVHSAAK